MTSDDTGEGRAVESPVSPRLLKLPNGLSIHYQNRNEALYVYKEVFEDQVYLKNGISIEDGDCILDVGANIGMFSMFVQRLRNGCQVHAFEPSPEICEILTANVAPFSPNVKVHRCGLANAEKEAVFTFYPKYSILSGFYTDEASERDMLRSAIKNQFGDRFQDSSGLEERHLDSLVDEMLARKTQYVCQLLPLSTIIEKSGIHTIDLLKVDAEKSELEVLSGICESDWKRIRQIVIEVHETGNGQLSEIVSLIKRNGFQVVVEAERQFNDSQIVNLYCIKI